ncbi:MULTISPECIES: HalOD1 output domain-containing protein [Haloprofundus]|uniref:HalOD1 output domain-containing protein n=1 Tax=Haloprofundus TaxID=1911573 RepID=UPI000E4445EE|nr:MULTISPECIES: HalOD1 output domain-containing protein [Haloprofundus]QCJ47795.1 hypothetical protein FCF25_12000 [Haloprofundus sp. MHR1]
MTEETADGERSRLVSSVPLDDYRTATEAVVTAVAALEETTPRGLPPLRRYLDADALENVLVPPRRDIASTVRVGFTYLDYEIVVTAGETAEIFESNETE